MSTNNILERQIIRFLCLILAVWTMASATQLILVYNFTGYASWINRYINDGWIITFIMFLQFFTGLSLLIAKLKHNDKLIVKTLFVMTWYNFALAGFSGWFTKMQGTFFATYLLITIFAMALYGYYKKRSRSDDRDLIL